jgi:hypothetical protein
MVIPAVPVLIDELFVVMPFTEERRSVPVVVIPNVLPIVSVEPTVSAPNPDPEPPVDTAVST